MYRETGKEEDLERVANMYERASVAEEYDALAPTDDLTSNQAGMQKFLEDMALMGDQDTKDDTRDAVKLMTIHASKGLEFDTVFISGCEEAMFSPTFDMDKQASQDKTEEERRLFYVAMTRAKAKLFLSWATMREMFGSTTVNTLCSFVVDIPQTLIYEETSSLNGTFTNNYDRFDGIDGDDGSEDDVIEYLNF